MEVRSRVALYGLGSGKDDAQSGGKVLGDKHIWFGPVEGEQFVSVVCSPDSMK